MIPAAEQIVVAIIVMTAAVYLLRGAWKFFVRREEAGCGHGCGSCSSKQPTATLVSIQPLDSTRDERK